MGIFLGEKFVDVLGYRDELRRFVVSVGREGICKYIVWDFLVGGVGFLYCEWVFGIVILLGFISKIVFGLEVFMGRS